MATESNGHADLRLAIVQFTEHIDSQFAEVKTTLAGLVSERECAERHRELNRRHLDVETLMTERIDRKVDRMFFAGVVATLIVLAAIGGIALKIMG